MTLIQETQSASDLPPLDQTQGLVSKIKAPTDGIQIVDVINGLAAIHQPETELVIWQRHLPSGFNEWVEAIDPSSLPHVRILVRPTDFLQAITPLIDEAGLPADQMREILLQDIDRLVFAFAEITNCNLVDIRLERIQHDACWKFHRDTIEARLLTTYRGPSTEWVPLENGARAINQQREYDGPLERLGQDDVALFTGKTAGPGRGVVHRSPPIKGTGSTRLLLCLNNQSIASPEPWTAD